VEAALALLEQVALEDQRLDLVEQDCHGTELFMLAVAVVDYSLETEIILELLQLVEVLVEVVEVPFNKILAQLL
jgi:hypothetical protein